METDGPPRKRRDRGYQAPQADILQQQPLDAGPLAPNSSTGTIHANFSAISPSVSSSDGSHDMLGGQSFINPMSASPTAPAELLPNPLFNPTAYINSFSSDPFSAQACQSTDAGLRSGFPTRDTQLQPPSLFTGIEGGYYGTAIEPGTPLPTTPSGTPHVHNVPDIEQPKAPASGYDDGVDFSAPPLEDIWTDTSLYRLDHGLPFDPAPLVNAGDLRPRKRGFDQFYNPDGPSPSSTNDLLRASVPALFPSVPKIRNRPPRPLVSNPFLESFEDRLPTLANRVRPAIPEDGVIDGYIKIRLSVDKGDEEVTGRNEARGLVLQPRRRRAVIRPDDGDPLSRAIPLLPPNFATGMKLDKTDEKLWKFHLNAYCAGRTLLPGNYWCDQLASIATKDDCARHALLAFATAYVLDFQPTEEMRLRANHHYAAAVRLLDAALRNQETYCPGREDGIVAAMVLILSNDIVNWESRRPRGQEPLWRVGARATRLILDYSDPGYRYWRPRNVQSSLARIGNANWIAYTDICAQPVTPLSEESTQSLFPWLLEGSKHDVHKIQGVTGVCSKLLHMFWQITHLAALLKKDAESTVVPIAAVKLKDRLQNLWQWSDLSPGHASADELLASCVLDENGQVNDPIKVTELSAHAWVPAAEIYLHCRVYRKPRSHPHVARSLKVLIQCIERLPCTGRLFTSQSPFFPVFLMAIVSCKPEERKVSRDWFEVVLSGAQCRSSVPPVWTAIQRLWEWLDHDLVEDPYDEDQPIGQRRAWWEEMVEKLVEDSGVLSLV